MKDVNTVKLVQDGQGNSSIKRLMCKNFQMQLKCIDFKHINIFNIWTFKQLTHFFSNPYLFDY